MTSTVSRAEALRVWIQVALHSFGGPAGQISVMHRILVEEKRWVREDRFLHALNYCMLLPGPEAQQLATYVGWLLHRTWGGLVAGGLFVLPGFVSILALSLLYAHFRDLRALEALFFGLKAAVLAIIVHAVLRLGRRALRHPAMVAVAAGAFVALFAFGVPFPWVILTCGVAGFVGGRLWGERFFALRAAGEESEGAGGPGGDGDEPRRPPWKRTVAVVLVCLLAWWAPVLGLAVVVGPDHVLVAEATFFSKVAVLTFGGAYAVLAYVAQEAVETRGWLEPGEMLDGLGMAETTPGPLIQVVQFVGFMGAFREPGGLDPTLAGVAASIVVTWVVFAPSFLFIFAGAPYVESIRRHPGLRAALATITAAVVGVIASLGLWFLLHTLFRELGEAAWGPLAVPLPVWASFEPLAAGLAAAAAVALVRFGAGTIATILATAGAGLVLRLVIGG